MLIEERYNLITNVLQDRKTVTIEELCNLLGVSKDTVRRDLITLEKRKVLKRTFGGAMLASKPVPALRHEQRLSQFRMAKDIIADAAVQLVKNNSVVMFDSSTTVQATVPLLAGKGIQAVTNSLPTAQSLSLIDDCRISLLPGTLHREQLYVIGADTIEKIASYHFDICFLGVFALDSCGLYTHTEEEGLDVYKRQCQYDSHFPPCPSLLLSVRQEGSRIPNCLTRFLRSLSSVCPSPARWRAAATLRLRPPPGSGIASAASGSK